MKWNNLVLGALCVLFVGYSHGAALNHAFRYTDRDRIHYILKEMSVCIAQYNYCRGPDGFAKKLYWRRRWIRHCRVLEHLKLRA